MDINYDSLWMMVKFAAIMLGLLLLVFVLAVLTPRIAKIADKLFAKNKKTPPERVDSFTAENSAEIKGIYDAQTTEALSGENGEACRYDNGKEIEDEQRN